VKQIKTNHFDVSTGIKTIELVDELQHCPLNFVITTLSVIVPSPADSIDLIEENDTGLLGSSHFEQFSNHSSPLSDILLYEL
jgi:hypothetical protein